MLFTSPAFLFLFLPLFLLVFRAASKNSYLTIWAKLTIIVGTYVFYAFENVGYLAPFVIATFMDLLWSVLLHRVERSFWRKLIVAASVVQNIGLLAVFKYINWIAEIFPHSTTIQALHAAFADANGIIVLPPGISFYLFESLSFVIDCYRHKIETPRDPLDFLTFISMFPRFIAGPIVRYADLEKSILEYGGPKFADGLFVFASGFAIKVLFADSFEKFVTLLFGSSYSVLGSWMAALSYTFQLYLDFSAYSLMAIGLGLVLGFPFPDNFREPYLSRNIREFWQRWHISLSTWLRDYLYIPLGGNRGSLWRTQFNLWLTMLIGGLWHGANLTYVVWGAYHGALLVVERALRNRGIEMKSKTLTFILVVFGWVYFRAKSIQQGERIISSMLGFNGGIGWLDVQKAILLNKFYAVLAGLAVIWTFLLEPQLREARNCRSWFDLSVQRVSAPVLGLVLAAFFVAVAMSLADKNIPFLYFQF